MQDIADFKFGIHGFLEEVWEGFIKKFTSSRNMDWDKKNASRMFFI